MTLSYRHWAALLALVMLWGSSYLMVEYALTTWQPAEITGLRVLLALIVLLTGTFAGRRKLPRDARRWGYFLAVALIGNCAPFFLISWGQQQVESGLAGILAATTPLAVLVLAHFTLADERLGRSQIAGFVLGFGGIIVLMGPDSLAALGGTSERLLGQLAVLAGAVCYAVATIITRFMPATHPVVTSAAVMLLATGVMSPASWGGLVRASQMTPAAAAAIAFLGLLGTGLASILYFYLVARTGARFTSYLNYLIPVWAVGLGAVVLGETVPLSAWFALALILSGLGLCQRGIVVLR